MCDARDASGYGSRTDPFTGRPANHSGLDFDVDAGHPVVAAAPGRVVVAGRRGPYGLMIEIGHGPRIKTRYAHLSNFAVKAGAKVAAGQTIGWSGATGRTPAPALHFEVRQDDLPLDPRKHLRPNPACNKGE